jgi:hypothetical protein
VLTNTTDRTAQQLMADALTVNGVTIGWAIDWRISDWTIPTGTWSYRGSYIGAINTIAAAAGAFVQPDPVTKTLRVRPRYPSKPWQWDTSEVIPDIELPASVVTNEGITWADKPAYNAVYISGTTSAGILASVTREGTSGNLQAPMITDPLITDIIAGRQRGVAILSDVGRQARYTLSLPVLPSTGIIEPGTMIKYVDNGVTRVGVVRGQSVTATQSSVIQTLEVLANG